MCGIIGYVGSRECKPLLLQGLERLEYRGYDSAGIALLEEGGLEYVRAVGPLGNLKERAGSNHSTATTGLGHTRWATHGGVTEANAHPLAGCDASKVSIVLNGIVENYRELSEGLAARRARVHLRDRRRDGHAPRSRSTTRVTSWRPCGSPSPSSKGHFAFVMIHHDHPGLLVGARQAGVPLVVGIGTRRDVPRIERSGVPARDAHACSSRATARSSPSRPEGATFQRADGTPVEHEPTELDWDDEGAEKGGFETFMLKEIYEQPEAVAETIGDRVRHGSSRPRGTQHVGQGRQGATQNRPSRLRHGVPRMRRRSLRDRGVGTRPRRVRHRERVDLPQPCHQRARRRHRDHAVGRDPRHDHGAPARARRGRTHGRDHEHDGLAGDARGRLGPVHQGRSRDGRGRVEDVHRPGRAALPRGAEARADPRDAAARRDRVHPRLRLQAADQDPGSSSTATIRSRRSRSATTTRTSSSTSAATSAFRWHSKVRSSSRRSRTSRPRRTRRGR